MDWMSAQLDRWKLRLKPLFRKLAQIGRPRNLDAIRYCKESRASRRDGIIAGAGHGRPM